MNTPNNKRKRNSQNKILSALIKELQTKDLNNISVTDICKIAGVNRTTFYANYIDIYDLAEKLKEFLENEVSGLFKDEHEHQHNSHNYTKLFQHIKENQIYYNTYFKLGADINFKLKQYDTELAEKYYDNKYIEYHVEFFRNGLNAVLKKWLNEGCKESPEEIAEIIRSEYSNKITF